LRKLDAIADLFGVATSDLIRSMSDPVEEIDPRLKELVMNYSASTDEGRSAIEQTAKISPRRIQNRFKRTRTES
jgi:hypothetical protein